VSISTAPAPGKCLTVAATPADLIPRTVAATIRATASVSEPNERIPSAGLDRVTATSATGA
jgi:hypothetical protein